MYVLESGFIGLFRVFKRLSKINILHKKVRMMDGINDELNNLIDEEVRQAKAIKQAKKIVDTRRPLTRAKIQEIKDMLQLGKDFE